MCVCVRVFGVFCEGGGVVDSCLGPPLFCCEKEKMTVSSQWEIAVVALHNQTMHTLDINVYALISSFP